MTHKVLPLALLLLLAACDRIDDPILKGNSPTPPPSGEVQRKVLLEEYTGHKCTYCPEAHQIADQLSTIYGDRLVIVSEHVGSLADPVPGNYSTNFHTDAGDAYFSQWTSAFIPQGLIDRTVYGGGIPIGRNDWVDDMQTEMAKTADLHLWFDAFTYNSSTSQVTTTVKCVALNPIDHALNLTVQLTEDHVIDWQLDLGTDVPNYDHRHVLRDNLNGTWGEILTSGPASVGDTLTKSYTYTLPAAGAVNHVITPSNCSLVAYVYSTQGDDQYEVLQVEERKFTP
jgi:hypothetical protein